MSKTTKRITSRVAMCFDCHFRDENYHVALERARQHAKRTGHHVTVESVHVIHYKSEKSND